MTLPYDLRVHFDTIMEDTVSGTVRVSASEASTCRQLLLWPAWRDDDHEELVSDGERKVKLVDWEEWRPGETYVYPFSFNGRIAKPGTWGVHSEVHRIGELEPDPPHFWPVPDGAVAEHGERSSYTQKNPAAPTQEERAASSDDAAKLIGHISLDLDAADSHVCGEAITGSVLIKSEGDISNYRLHLYLQWRTHGKTTRRCGRTYSFTVAALKRCKPMKYYSFKFRFIAPSGPRSYHAHSEKLDWFIWPVLIPAAGGDPLPLLAAETTIDLQPSPGSLRVSSAAEANPPLPHVFLLFIASLIATALLILNWIHIWSLGEWGPMLSLFLAFVTAVLLLASLAQIRNLELAELMLGKVHATIDGQGEVAAALSFLPRRTIQLKHATLYLTVEEVTTVDQGSTSKTTRKILFSAREQKDLNEVAREGVAWNGQLALPLKRQLPVSRSRPFGRNTEIAIVWKAQVTLHPQYWFRWRRTYKLEVRGA